MKLSEIRMLTRGLPRPESPAQQRRLLEQLRELGLDPQNFYQELEMESRFVDTHRDESHSNSGVQLHSHTFSEVIFCRNTCGVEYLVGAERYRVQRGDILLIAPGVSHRPLLPEELQEPYRRYVLWISPELQEILNRLYPRPEGLAERGNFLRTAGTKWEFLEEYFRRGTMETEAAEPGWEMAVLGNTIQLLSLLRRAATDKATLPLPAEKPELLDRVMAYMEKNLSEKLTLQEIARQFYVSESTISQLFRKKLGVSFHRCLTQRRLIAAKSLIETGMPLEDVGRQVGFVDYSSFYRAFRQEYGICPRQYRRRHHGEESAEPGRILTEVFGK